MASNSEDTMASSDTLHRSSPVSDGRSTDGRSTDDRSTGGDTQGAAWIRSLSPERERPGSESSITRVTPAQTRLTVATLAVVAVVTVCILPFAGTKGPALPGFVPAYQATVFLLYALTYLHIVAHFRRTRIVALSHIAVGCLFPACILLVQMFSFPIWGPEQLVGSTPATTSWLWIFWHLGPAMLTVSYVVALSRSGDQPPVDPSYSVRRMVLQTLGTTAILVGIATGLSTWGLVWLPTVVTGDNYEAMTSSGVGPAVMALTAVALALLCWRTRCNTMVDLCLAMSLALLLFDDLLTLNGGSRQSVGWYAGRAEAAGSAAILLTFYIADLDRRCTHATDTVRSMARDQAALNELVIEQRDANAALAMQAYQDGLTGLANRRHLDEALRQEWLRAARDARPVTLLMIDVDFFKLYNDYYGHQAGDKCLSLIGELMREVARRPADLTARYGGEEFVMLLPETDRAGGLKAANALSGMLAWRNVPHEASTLGRLTVSIGVASATPMRGDSGPEGLVAAADQALYQAKNGGRDQVVSVRLAGPSDTLVHSPRST